jgi:acyl-CoA hydrolase
LVSVAECTFERPIHIGDVARCDAEVSYTESASLEVTVTVYCEDLRAGKSHRTNRARLWYVQVAPPEDGSKALFITAGPVPTRPGLSPEAGAAGAARYSTERKQPRQLKAVADDGSADDWTADDRRLAQLMLPSDASLEGIVFGGTLMKMMDSAAGIAAYMHCRNNIVVSSIRASFSTLCWFRLVVRPPLTVMLSARIDGVDSRVESGEPNHRRFNHHHFSSHHIYIIAIFGGPSARPYHGRHWRADRRVGALQLCVARQDGSTVRDPTHFARHTRKGGTGRRRGAAICRCQGGETGCRRGKSQTSDRIDLSTLEQIAHKQDAAFP